MERWNPTVDSLTQAIPGYTFVLLPMNYTEIHPAVENKIIDFILTNTGHYIELETNEGINRLVTLVKSIDGISTKKFGGVIFTRADQTEINTISDLKGKIFLAVRKSSLGGFLVAWEQFLLNNLDPFSDLSSLTYNGLPQDNIVFKVLSGDADAGTVRTTVLEQMEKEGKIKLDDFKIIDQKATEGFPFIHSTKLYPEWPFSKLSHVDDDLAERVTIALLNIKHNNPAAIAGNYDRWVPPLDYQSVHTLLTTLQKFIPICSSCKNVKDDKGYWEQVESYISKHSETEFSHGYCPQCYEKEMARIGTMKQDKDSIQDYS